MSKINSRSKGSRAERVAAEVLSKWTGKKFSRVPSSGGLQWKNSHAKGDIVCAEEGHFFPFCVEVKNYKEINFEHLLYLPNPKILEFWSQCTRDAKIANKIPLLMMRYDGLPSSFFFIVMYTKDYNKIQMLIDNPWDSPKNNLSIFTTKDLFELNKNQYSRIKPLAKKICKQLKRDGDK